jgi:hypothetical protein
MKFQWQTMTDFAKNVLNKLGAVPKSEYDKVVVYNHRLHAELRILAKNSAKSFPFAIEPDVAVSYDRAYQGYRVTLQTKQRTFIIPDYELHTVKNTEVYRKHFIDQLSNDWAAQTEKVLDEMVGKM